MKNKKINKSKNLNLAIYFGLLVTFIIIVSLVFKIVDIIKDSKFDGENRFSIAMLNSKNTEIVTVSPREGSLTRITITSRLEEQEIRGLLIPIDVFIIPKTDFESDSKSYFFKIFLNSRKIENNLSLFDLVKLSLYSASVNNEKITEEKVVKQDSNKISQLAESLFRDPSIVDGKLSIQIINSTSISGLGNKLARYISNMGGNVILVKSSNDEVGDSVILYRDENYTVNELSERLNIPLKKDENNSISDVKIIIGKDIVDLFKY